MGLCLKRSKQANNQNLMWKTHRQTNKKTPNLSTDLQTIWPVPEGEGHLLPAIACSLPILPRDCIGGVPERRDTPREVESGLEEAGRGQITLPLGGHLLNREGP